MRSTRKFYYLATAFVATATMALGVGMLDTTAVAKAENNETAITMMYGATIAAGHHNSHFDFNEACLWKAAGLLSTLAIAYTHK